MARPPAISKARRCRAFPPRPAALASGHRTASSRHRLHRLRRSSGPPSSPRPSHREQLERIPQCHRRPADQPLRRGHSLHLRGGVRRGRRRRAVSACSRRWCCAGGSPACGSAALTVHSKLRTAPIYGGYLRFLGYGLLFVVALSGDRGRSPPPMSILVAGQPQQQRCGRGDQRLNRHRDSTSSPCSVSRRSIR